MTVPVVCIVLAIAMITFSMVIARHKNGGCAFLLFFWAIGLLLFAVAAIYKTCTLGCSP